MAGWTLHEGTKLIQRLQQLRTTSLEGHWEGASIVLGVAGEGRLRNVLVVVEVVQLVGTRRDDVAQLGQRAIRRHVRLVSG